jgi:hypothetical protein
MSRPTAMDVLKTARNLDTIAEQVEPLAQAMATLADDLRSEMATARIETQGATSAMCQSLDQTAQAATQAARRLSKAALAAQGAAEAVRTASRGGTWRLWVALVAGATLPMIVLLIALWILLPLEIAPGREGTIWLRLQ